jgi:trimethylamine--corrinoid protein Co-methyltransferase
VTQPGLQILSPELLEQIVTEGFALLEDPGVKVHSREGLSLLAEAGARVDFAQGLALIPEEVVREALHTVPSGFTLYDRDGRPTVFYQDDRVHFDPGSAAVHILDPQTGEHRPPDTTDFVNLVKLTESLPPLDAQSTAMVPADVPQGMGDLYRLYLVLLYARKPVITGAFGIEMWHVMKDMLVAVRGSEEALRQKPLAVFDVAPSPPLIWSELVCQNMIDCARYGIPAQMVSMPLAGGTAPAVLAGAVAQHTAESLSGITIHQLAAPGAPIVWGGAPAIFDMRHGTPPMGAIETAMIDCAYAQVGKSFGLPTHCYLGASDAKLVDAQAGLESGITAVLGALAGINMISGAGMLDFLACQSLEKLVVDAEGIGMAKRLLRGLTPQGLDLAGGETLALSVMREVGHQGKFLASKHTRRWFSREQYLPSPVVDRASLRGWQQAGALDMAARAHRRVKELLESYERPELPVEVEKELQAITQRVAQKLGMDKLPPLPA